MTEECDLSELLKVCFHGNDDGDVGGGRGEELRDMGTLRSWALPDPAVARPYLIMSVTNLSVLCVKDTP